MPRSSPTLPGYTGLTTAELSTADDFTVTTQAKAIRITGPFLVRNDGGVRAFKDGYLCQDAAGRPFGVEKASLGTITNIDLSNVPIQCKDGSGNPPKVGVAFDANLDDSNEVSPRHPIHWALVAGIGGLPAGLTLNGSTGHITGTPPGPGGTEAYYFEVDTTYDDEFLSRRGYYMAVLAA